MLEPTKLQALSPQQIVEFAVKERFVGMGLRAGDRLEEIQVDGDRATSRPILANGSPEAFHHPLRPRGRRLARAPAGGVRADAARFRRSGSRVGTNGERDGLPDRRGARGRKLVPADFEPPMPRERLGSAMP